MNYNQLLTLYENDLFRKIDNQENAYKFYLLRTLSKSNTLKNFCTFFNVEKDLDTILSNGDITTAKICNYIKEIFVYKKEEEIRTIEAELNKMSNFDWGGSQGNNLEKNIVNNFIKKTYKYTDIKNAIDNQIQKSVTGYTLNSWYNHWSSILIEEIFNKHTRILPTVDLVSKIDFFIDETPYDLKVTYFPEQLMKEKIKKLLYKNFGYKNELTCLKSMAKKLDITIPNDLDDRSLSICIYNLINESIVKEAQNFIIVLNKIKKEVIDYYINNPNELIIWLYENQGEMRFDAANRFYVVLVDTKNIYDSWKLKRNFQLLNNEITKTIDKFNSNCPNKIKFHWNKNNKDYECISELCFIIK